MNKILKKISLSVFSLISALYTAFVAMCLWNWFVATAFSDFLSIVPYWNMLGFIIFIDLILCSIFESRDLTNAGNWTLALSILRMFSPESKKEEVEKNITTYLKPDAFLGFWLYFGKLGRSTFFLMLGFLVRLLSQYFNLYHSVCS